MVLLVGRWLVLALTGSFHYSFGGKQRNCGDQCGPAELRSWKTAQLSRHDTGQIHTEPLNVQKIETRFICRQINWLSFVGIKTINIRTWKCIKCVGATSPAPPSHSPSPKLGSGVWQVKGYKVMFECGCLPTVPGGCSCKEEIIYQSKRSEDSMQPNQLWK